MRVVPRNYHPKGEDKFVRDPNKTTDSSQRPPQDCPKCGNPVDGLYCRHCALLRKKLKEDPGENFSQSPPYIDHHCCYGCGDSLDGIFCQRCTCKSSEKGAHHGYNCPPKVLIISNPEPCHNQNVEEFPQSLPSFHLTCYPGDENSFAYDSTPNFVNDSPNVFNPPSQPPTYFNEFCRNDAHYSYDFIDHLNLQQRINDSMIELRGTFQAWLQQHKNQVVNLDSYSPKPLQCQKIPICYDDEESSTPLRDIIISELPPCIAITPILSTKKPKDSLIIGDEHLDTIPEKESDEFIKSSVKNLVPNSSESEDEREYDVPICDDFTTFSNLLFDSVDDFSSSDKESVSDEDIPKEIYSNPLFDEEIISIKIDPCHFDVESDLIESLLNQDSLIISSSKIDSILDEFVGGLIFRKLIPPGIDEAECDPEKEIHLIEKLFDSPIEEIDLSLTPNDSMLPGIENDDYESEGDILILEELLSNDSLSLFENKSFHFDIPSSPRPPAKPPDDDEIEPNSEILTVKVVSDISEHYVLMTRLFPTQPTLASNQKKSHHLLSHRILKAFQLSSKSPTMIYGGNISILDISFLHFYPS
nr:hypothetical protein [Tanacetum cinerariifolium]